MIYRDAKGRFTFDPFDPRGWTPGEQECRIWLDGNAGMAAVVDAADYAWALQWLWQATANSTGLKFYATRKTRVGTDGPQSKIYLHKAVLFRHQGPAPTPRHIIGDHLDGDSLNCRRSNLRWATPSQNRCNYGGSYLRQLQMAL